MTKLPNFLIVGAAKSGTTSLYEYLRTHPQIFMPARKEPSYFEPKAGGVGSWDEYCDLFDGAGEYKRVGEASVSYLMSPKAPERIERTLGKDVDIVVLLRNPVAMAYSNWGHQAREGYERLDFLSALYDEERRLSDPEFERTAGRWIYDMTYVHRASYADQIARYIKHFGQDRMHVFLFEEFFKPGLPLYAELLKALDIDPAHRPTEAVYNKAGTIRSSFIRRVISERMAWKEPIKWVTPPAVRTRMMAALARFNRIGRNLPPIPPEAQRYLKMKFAPEVDVLSTLLGRNFKAIWGFDG